LLAAAVRRVGPPWWIAHGKGQMARLVGNELSTLWGVLGLESAMSKLAGVVCVVCIVVGLAAIAGIVGYAMCNESGHTGANPYLALAVFVPAAVVGVARVTAGRLWRLRAWPGLLAIAIGCAGVALLIYLDRTNTLLQYEVWLARGMP